MEIMRLQQRRFISTFQSKVKKPSTSKGIINNKNASIETLKEKQPIIEKSIT
jgi:hypothetical protein